MEESWPSFVEIGQNTQKSSRKLKKLVGTQTSLKVCKLKLELYKEFKFDDANNCYMHSPEFPLENETRKILCDFEIQTDLLNPETLPDLRIVNIKIENLTNWDFAVPADLRVKLKEGEKKHKCMVGWLVGFHSISICLGYLTPNS